MTEVYQMICFYKKDLMDKKGVPVGALNFYPDKDVLLFDDRYFVDEILKFDSELELKDALLYKEYLNYEFTHENVKSKFDVTPDDFEGDYFLFLEHLTKNQKNNIYFEF